jgi:hypothetical protein
MPNTPSTLAVLGCIATFLAAMTAHATDLIQESFLNPRGGNGFRVECPSGSYLTGFSGRAGAWIDTMTIACSPWLPGERRLGDPTLLEDRSVGTSGDGEPTASGCPAGWVILNETLLFSQWDDSGLLHSITFDCTPVEAAWRQIIPRSFGSRAPHTKQRPEWGYSPVKYHLCPRGEFATGIHGRSGLFIDAFGLICGSAPDLSVARTAPSNERNAQERIPNEAVVKPAPDAGVVMERNRGVTAPPE